MSGLITFFVFIGLTVLLIIIFRLFGAWMLRINELIKQQNEIISILKKIHLKLPEKDSKDFEFLNK
jgi:hypothetical protein